MTTPQLRGLRKTGKCWVHGTHRPESLTHVFHHIIPREWQLKYHPPVERWTQGKEVWAPDCILVCPTGHANIHYHIRKIQELGNYESYKVRTREAKVAKQAFINWVAYGGSMDTICKPR